jgi:hypothetical protein
LKQNSRHYRNLVIRTEEVTVDHSSFFLPWEKPSVLCLRPATDVFLLKIHWAEAQNVCVCVCVITELCSVVFYIIRAAHKFDFRLVINEKSNKWRPVQRSCSEKESCFLHDLYVSPRPSLRVLRDSTQAVQINCILFSKV